MEVVILTSMHRAAQLEHPADWLVRARHDRVLPEGDKLFADVLADKPVGQVSFHFRPRRGVKARDVVPQLHVKRVKLRDGKRWHPGGHLRDCPGSRCRQGHQAC